MLGTKITLKYRPSQPNAEITVLCMELADGPARITWNESIVVEDDNGIIQLDGYDLYLEEEGRDITSKNIANAKIKDALWDVQDKKWCSGEIEILSAHITVQDTKFDVTVPDTTLPRPINYRKLDLGVNDLVHYFNSVGLRTSMSCDGRAGHGYGFLWVEFHPSVTETDILQFMETHTAKDKEYTGNGWFGSRFMLDKMFGTTTDRQCLVYVASDSIMANKDIGTWRYMDRENKKKGIT